MLTLYTFGPAFGQPDPSPFCIKALVLLKMSGQDFETKRASLRKAPKGKGPYLRDGDELIPDSSFIRFHLEDRYGVDFDPGLSAADKGIAWAFEKMCDEHVYFQMLHARWVVDENFDKGPRSFFEIVPTLMRPFVISKVRGAMKRSIYLQGTGRHSTPEIERLGAKALTAISDFLGQKKFLMGENPCGADASIFGCINCILCPVFDTGLRAQAESLDNLVAYNARGLALWFPDRKAGAK